MDNNFSTDEKTARLSSQLGMAYDILRAEASLHNMDILTIILVLLAYKRFSDIHESNEKDSHPSGKVIISIPPDFRWEKLIGNPQPLRLLASHFREICRRNQELERLGEVIEIERYIEQLPFPSQWELINLFGNLDLSQSSWSDNGLSQTVSRFIEEWNQGNGDSNNDLIPYGLSKLLVNVLDVRKTDSIYFPACGLGTSIMAAIDHLSRDIFSEPDKSSLVQSIQIRGEEKNREALAFALLRLAIAGHRGIDLTNEDYLTTTYEDLYRGVAGPIPRRFKAAFSENLEALRSEEAVEAFINAFRESEHIDKKEEGFLELFRRVSRKYSTVTILTPPFGLHLSRNLPNTLWFEGDNVEVPSGRGEFMFLLLALQMVSSRGKLGILIPAKYLTQVNLTNKIWSMLVNSDYLEVILTLPERYGYAHIPLALAIFNKEKPKFKKNKVAFAKLQGVPHNQKVIITDDDISSISKFSKTFEPVRDDQVIVTLEEIQQNNFDLSPERYIGTFFEELKALIKKEQAAKLGDICKVIRGKVRRPTFASKGISFITTKELAKDVTDPILDFTETHFVISRADDLLIQEKCILVSLVGESLKPTIYDPDFYKELSGDKTEETPDEGILIGHNIAMIVPYENIDFDYLYYQLYSPLIEKQHKAFLRRGGIPSISLTSLKSIIVPLPKSIQEQQLFVTQQKSAFLAIENARHEMFKQRLKLIDQKREAEFSIVRHLTHSIKPKIQIARSPINSLLRFLKEQNMLNQILSERLDGTSETVAEALEQTITNLNQIADVLDNCRNLVVNEISDKDFQEVDICALFKDEIFRLHVNKPYDLRLTCKVKFPVRLHKESFVEAINSLIKNAEDHAFRGHVEGAQLRFEVNEVGDDLVIDYMNNGLPFPDNMEEKDFLTFGRKRIDSPGDGLGGAWIGKVIEAHHGNFEIVRDENPLHFRIILPKGGK